MRDDTCEWRRSVPPVKKSLPYSEFTKHKNRASGLSDRCKVCNNATRKAYYDNPKNKDKIKAYFQAPENKEKIKAYYQTPKAKQKERERNLKEYGITQGDYDDLWIAQGGLCAICRERSPKTLHVDHCHKTGKVRGLLCNGCNFGIGHLRDSVIILENAIRYLNKNA